LLLQDLYLIKRIFFVNFFNFLTIMFWRKDWKFSWN